MKMTLLGLTFCTGVLLAGSEGRWFPWINLVGIGLMVSLVWVLREEV